VQAALEAYRPGQADGEQRGLHFHKGQPERFRSTLTPAQLARCAEAFGEALAAMGYAV
jgi:hypothetical protein